LTPIPAILPLQLIQPGWYIDPIPNDYPRELGQELQEQRVGLHPDQVNHDRLRSA
jgi:hypothetical protein